MKRVNRAAVPFVPPVMRSSGVLLALVLALTACAPAALPKESRQVDPILGTAERGKLGTVLTADGQTVYLFAKDKPGETRCFDQCAQTWPPIIVTRHPETRGAIQGKLGTVKRDDGRRQLTYNDLPVYLYIEDAPHSEDANGQDVDHEWYVLKP
ncbi:MAG: hypothetical protein NVS9B6_10670 [Candidatus Limnocylindrales bacterium]